MYPVSAHAPSVAFFQKPGEHQPPSVVLGGQPWLTVSVARLGPPVQVAYATPISCVGL